MVWKSKRWQGLLSKAEKGGFLVDKEECAPQPLEIAYLRPDGSEVEELVYEDSTGHDPKQEEDDELPARLLVPLNNVLKLKELCEHEHARYDECVETLSICRSDYMKELCWLREQLHLLRNDPPTRDLPDENFEVRWFQPPKYIDPDLKKFMMDVIADNVQHLFKDIEALRGQVADLQAREQALLGDPSARALLRRMLEDNKAGFILSELSSILRKQEDIEDLERVAKEILREAFVPPEVPQVRVEPEVIVRKEVVQDPALLQEVESLRKKTLMDEQLIKKLRESVEQGLETRLSADVEKEQAQAEKTRADFQEGRANEERRLKEEAQSLAHKEKRRVEELQAKVDKLQKELATKAPAPVVPKEVARQVRQSVKRLSSAIDVLNHGTSSQSKRRTVVGGHLPGLGASGDLARSFASLGTVDESRTTADESGGGLDELSRSFYSERGVATANSISSGLSSHSTVHGGPDELARSFHSERGLGTANSMASGTSMHSSGLRGSDQRPTIMSLNLAGGDAPDNLDDDVMNLSTLAAVLEDTIPRTLGEFDALNVEHDAVMARDQEEDVQAQHAKELEAANEASKQATKLQAEFDSRLQEVEEKKRAESEEIQKQVQELRAQLQEEKSKNAELEATIEALEVKNAKLCQKMQHYKTKAEEAKKKLKALKQPTDDDSSESEIEDDDSEDDDMKFLLSYTRRTRRLSALGKRRWEMLSEDAECAQKKREYIMGVHRLSNQEEPPDALQMILEQQQGEMSQASALLANSRKEQTSMRGLLAASVFAAKMKSHVHAKQEPHPAKEEPRYEEQQHRASFPGRRKLSLEAPTMLGNRQHDQLPNAKRSLGGGQQEEPPNALRENRLLSKIQADRHQNQATDTFQMVSSQQEEQVKAAFSFLTASRSASSFLPSNHSSDSADVSRLGAMQRDSSLTALELATDMWPKNSLAFASTFPSQHRARSRMEPVEIKLLGRAAEKQNSLQKARRVLSQPDAEPQSLQHQGDAVRGSSFSKFKEQPTLEAPQPELLPVYEGPLSTGLVETFWNSSPLPMEDWPQGASSSSAAQPANALQGDRSAVAAAPVPIIAQRHGNSDLPFKATEPPYRSALSEKRQSPEKSRKIFQTTWHSGSNKGSLSGTSASFAAPKDPVFGDSLSELLSADRQTLPPMKGRLPPATKGLEERHMRGRAVNKMSKTARGSSGWPAVEKRSNLWPTRAPLTNAAMANQHYSSEPDLRFRATLQSGTDTGEAFLPEVLPRFPAGRQLKMKGSYLPGCAS